MIIAVEGTKLNHLNDLSDVISEKDAGDRVALRVLHDGEERRVLVELGERPARAPQRP